MIISKNCSNFFSYFFIPFHFNTVFAQSDSSELHYNIDSLNKIYGKHKHFINQYKLVSLIALSYYHELIDEILELTKKYKR